MYGFGVVAVRGSAVLAGLSGMRGAAFVAAEDSLSSEPRCEAPRG